MMFDFDRNIEISSLEDEIQSIKSLNEKFINIHELNKKTNDPIKFKVNNTLPSGMILIDDLSNFSKGIQNIYRKAVNFKTFGPSKRLKKHIINSTGLVISEVRAGSFEIEIKQHRSHILNDKINSDFDALTDSVNKPSLNILNDVISDLYEENLSEIVKSYGTETIKSTKEWVKNIYKSHNTFEFENSENNYQFDSRKIKNIKVRLDELSVENKEEKVLKGSIAAINHDNFTIIIRDENLNENFSVKVRDQKFKNLKLTSNTKVKVPVTYNEILIGEEVLSSDFVLNDIAEIISIKQ
ncbi:hypothetical protein [Salinicoccus sp. HZC-1]|uniref:hypothetical protein n=1 Tax=Salinicoccus sp. HZC-1 TaxID=3385497 RepID=UPI00398A6A9B